jgi:4'-phosphopantetheinyl transferase
MDAGTHAYWLEQTEADVPVTNHWLSAEEISRFAGLRVEKRRRDWRLGRWTAKRAVSSWLNIADDVHFSAEIEIRAAASGAPEVFLFNQLAAISISLSHRGGRALCVVGSREASLGCDLEVVELRDRSFLTEFFSASEQNLVDQAPAEEQPLLATLLWSAKESALKALKVGLRLETTRLDVIPTYTPQRRADGAHPSADIAWLPLSVNRINEQILYGWWRCANNMVRTVVFNPYSHAVRILSTKPPSAVVAIGGVN